MVRNRSLSPYYPNRKTLESYLTEEVKAVDGLRVEASNPSKGCGRIEIRLTKVVGGAPSGEIQVLARPHRAERDTDGLEFDAAPADAITVGDVVDPGCRSEAVVIGKHANPNVGKFTLLDVAGGTERELGTNPGGGIGIGLADVYTIFVFLGISGDRPPNVDATELSGRHCIV